MKLIGVMTGNSLDACDVVLTSFEGGKMRDISSFSLPSDDVLRKDLLSLRELIKTKNVSMPVLLDTPLFQEVHDRYIHWVAKAIQLLIEKAGISKAEICAIGFHGQTLDHCPPSVAKNTAKLPYTLQVGSGQMLANLIGIPVVYDFRSEDIRNGGEGAPLMPPHNAHIAHDLGLKNALFFNAGNTSNLALIQDGEAEIGFDCGPFNEFSDKIMRHFFDKPFDKDAFYAQKGQLDNLLLEKLFQKSALDLNGDNFYEILPPKSADPKWYHFEIIEKYVAKSQPQTALYDALYTVAYFSAYLAVYSLNYAIRDNSLPADIILFGGGWHNKVALATFSMLLNNEGVVLKAHKDIFEKIYNSFKLPVRIRIIDQSAYMEARLMADCAYYFLNNKPWTTPQLTGAQKPCILGKIAYPDSAVTKVDKISSASAGWQKNLF